MAIINKIGNTATITFGGNTITSNVVDTILLLEPTIVKTVDKTTASIGETLTYTVTITNVGLSPINNIPFADLISEGSTYVVGSFMVNGAAVPPTASVNTLSYTIPTLDALGVETIVYQVVVVGGEL